MDRLRVIWIIVQVFWKKNYACFITFMSFQHNSQVGGQVDRGGVWGLALRLLLNKLGPSPSSVYLKGFPQEGGFPTLCLRLVSWRFCHSKHCPMLVGLGEGVAFSPKRGRQLWRGGRSGELGDPGSGHKWTHFRKRADTELVALSCPPLVCRVAWYACWSAWAPLCAPYTTASLAVSSRSQTVGLLDLSLDFSGTSPTRLLGPPRTVFLCKLRNVPLTGIKITWQSCVPQ